MYARGVFSRPDARPGVTLEEESSVRLIALFILGAALGACRSPSGPGEAEKLSAATRQAYNQRLDRLCNGLPAVQRAYCASKVPE